MAVHDTTETDEEIIAAYLQGSEPEFSKIVERYTPTLYNFTARLTNKNDASDLVQETFIKAWKNLHKFDSAKASFKTWVFTIAKNTCTDFLRKKKFILFTDMEKDAEDGPGFAESIPDENLLPDDSLQKLQDAEFLNHALDILRPEYRSVLILHYQEDMTFEEVGEVLGKPLNTVKSQHRRALMELRKLTEINAPN